MKTHDFYYELPPELIAQTPIVRAQRLDTGESMLTHAMVFLGVNLDDEGKPNRWKVENSWSDERGVGEIAAELALEDRLRMFQEQGRTRVVLHGEDVSDAIRTQEMGRGASLVSALPAVRAALLELQRQLGREGGVVLEGRDIGSVVFPDAEAKFFLTASAEVRAERRRAELEAAGQAVDLQQVLEEVRERDRRDSERPIAPLKRAPDAILIDSSHLTIDEAVKEIVRRVREVAGAEPGSEGGEAR